jgi:mannose-binding lectin 2
VRNIRNNAHPTKIKITYMAEKSLTVQLATEADPDRWEPCFTLPNVRIPSVAYLGFSAETGELADSHDIISIESRNLYIPASDGSKTPASPGGSSGMKSSTKKKKPQKGQKSEKSSGGWTWMFVKFILFGFAIAGAWAGFTAYRVQKSKSRF